MSRLFFNDNFRSPREIWVELARAIWRHKGLVLVAQLATMLSVYGYLQLITERYQAESHLLVKLGRQNVDGPVTAARGTVTTMGVREEEINSNISLLSSRSLVEDAVDELGLARFDSTLPKPTTFAESIKYHLKTTVKWVKLQIQEGLIAAQIEKRLTPRETIILFCHQKLTVERVKNSDVIQVRIWMPSPDLAVSVEEALLRRFLDRHVKARAAEVSDDFFSEQTEGYREKMEKLDQELLTLMDGSQLALIDRQRDLLLTRLNSIREVQDESKNELALLNKSQATRVDASHEATTPKTDKLSNVSTTSNFPNPVVPVRSEPTTEMIPSLSISSLKDRIVSLYLDKSRIITVEGADAPSLQAIDAQLRRFESQMEQILVAKIEQYEEHASAITDRLSTLNDGEMHVVGLKRDRDMAERNYLSYAARSEDSRISRELDRDSVSNVSVLTPPVASSQPIYPKKKTMFLISIAAGLLLGIGLALVLEYFDDTLRGSAGKEEIQGWEILGHVRLSPINSMPMKRNGTSVRQVSRSTTGSV